MCGICGCSEPAVMHEHPDDVADPHDHGHADGAVHEHHERDAGIAPEHSHAPGLKVRRMVQIEQDLMAKNRRYAEANRADLGRRGIFALNLMSSPGAGKTTLLVRTIEALKARFPVTVIEGDQQTDRDAQRIRSTGVPVRQINTGKGCHLDAHMVGHALSDLQPLDDSVLFIENVGNLVCPAGFDLGEARKVVVLSVTEGEDKPIKYPDMFRAADLMIINKVDLLPYVEFDVEACIGHARAVNKGLCAIMVSATRGDGLEEWVSWIAQGRVPFCAEGRVGETVSG